MNTASIRWFLGACAAALIAGCGGKVVMDSDGAGQSNGSGGATSSGPSTSTSSGTSISTDPNVPGVTQACVEYCEAIEVQGCFDVQDCHGRCMAIYVPECIPEVEAALACLPPWLSDQCVTGYPYNSDDGCMWLMDDLFDCSFAALGNCDSTDGTGSLGCTGETQCPGTQLDVECDEDGQCLCIQDGVLVGSCAMPFVGGDACSPGYHCCRPFYVL